MIYVAASQNGYKLRDAVVDYLKSRGYRVDEIRGPEDEPVDYPQLARQVGLKVAHDFNARGILFSGKGTGMCISANKVPGISASVVFTESLAERTRLEDNSNVLCLPSAYISEELAKDIVSTWLSTSFSGSDYNVRVVKEIRAMEKEFHSHE